MCSALVCVDVAVRQPMETQTDGQRNLLDLNAAGILWLSLHRSMNWFSVELAANDKSCTISNHVSNGSLNGAHMLLCPLYQLSVAQKGVSHSVRKSSMFRSVM